MYLADRLKYSIRESNEIAWSRRKRLINDNHELEMHRIREEKKSANSRGR